MAQKAAKATAKRNSQILNRSHLIALAVHLVFLLFRLLLVRALFTRTSLILYATLSAPALAIELWFERGSRPSYNGLDLRSSGEDLEAKGLTEWMWDVLYWTWGCTLAAAVLGDWAWWFYIAIPVYSAWLAFTTFGNVRQSLGGGAQAMPASGANGGTSGATSKRQQKMEKRGNKVQYR